MRLRLAVVLLAAVNAVAAAAQPAPADAVRALTADGTWIEGAPAFAGDAWTIGAQRIADAKLVALVEPREPPAIVDGALVLRAGDVLIGVVRSVENGKVRFRSDAFGALEVPLDQVLAMALSPRPLASFARLPDEAGAELANGERLAGTLSFVNDEEIGVDTGKRVQRLRRERVALIALGASPAKSSAAADVHCLRLTGGDLVCGRIATWNGDGIAFAAAYGKATFAPWQVCAAWTRAKALTPLSALAVAERKATPFFDEQPVFELDRAAPATALAPNGERCEHGLRLGARQELAWDVDGASALVGEIGVDATAPRGAGANVTVFADDKPAATFECRAGEAAKPFAVPLTGAKRLRVVVDFAKPNRPGDGVDLGWATVVR